MDNKQQYSAFISYATRDTEIAEKIRDYLAAQHINCWYAPSNIKQGQEYGNEILNGIKNSANFILLLSNSANDSPMVRREVERAASLNKPFFTIRIEQVKPQGSLEFFASATHWLDAWDDNLEQQLQILQTSLTNKQPPALQQIQTNKKTPYKILSTTIIAITVIIIGAIWINTEQSQPAEQTVVDNNAIEKNTTAQTANIKAAPKQTIKPPQQKPQPAQTQPTETKNKTEIETKDDELEQVTRQVAFEAKRIPFTPIDHDLDTNAPDQPVASNEENIASERQLQLINNRKIATQPADFIVGKLTTSYINFAPLIKHYHKIDYIEVRHNQNEPFRTLDIRPSDSSELTYSDRKFSLVFRYKTNRSGLNTRIKIPNHWQQAHVELQMKNGQRLHQLLGPISTEKNFGLLATPVGKNAHQAPAVYIIGNKNPPMKSHYFSLSYWHQKEQGEKSINGIELWHENDIITLPFKNRVNQQVTEYQYSAKGLANYSQYLPFDPSIRQQQPIVLTTGELPAKRVAISEDGYTIAVADIQQNIHLFNGNDGTLIGTLPINKKAIKLADEDIHLGPKGKKILTTVCDNNQSRRFAKCNLIILSTKTGKLIANFAPNSGKTHGELKFTTDGKAVYFHRAKNNRFYSTDEANRLLDYSTGLWSLEDGSTLFDPKPKTDAKNTKENLFYKAHLIGTLQNSRQILLLSSKRNRIYLVDITPSSPKILAEKTFDEKVTYVVLSHDSQLLAVYSDKSQMVKLLDAQQLTEKFQFYSQLAHFRFSENDRWLLTRPNLDGKKYALYDTQNGKQKYTFSTNEYLLPNVKFAKAQDRYNLLSAPSNQVLDFIPFEFSASYVKDKSFPYARKTKTHFLLSRDDFMLWSIDKITTENTQRLYFVDLINKRTLQLNNPNAMDSIDFAVNKDANRMVAIRSDGHAIMWKTR